LIPRQKNPPGEERLPEKTEEERNDHGQDGKIHPASTQEFIVYQGLLLNDRFEVGKR
jgi:hypothetical protein